MTQTLLNKIVAYAMKAHIDFRMNNRAGEFINEDELKKHFIKEADDIPSILTLLSHPLSQKHFLNKDSNGNYAINENGKIFFENGFKSVDEKRWVRQSENAKKINSVADDRPIPHVLLVIFAILIAITIIVAPIYLFLSGR
jgi:hypothetical protein